MKINGKYTVRKVGKDYFAVAVDSASPADSMIKLNDTGAYIFERLLNGIAPDAIVTEMTAEFDVTPETAAGDIHAFISMLRQVGIVD